MAILRVARPVRAQPFCSVCVWHRSNTAKQVDATIMNSELAASSLSADVSLERSRPKRRRRLPVLAAAAVLIAPVAWIGYGMVVGTLFSQAIDRWIADRRAEGYVVSFAAREDVRRPWQSHAVFVAPVMAAPPGNDAWTWRADRVVVTLNPLRPQQLHLDLRGRHEVVADGPRPIRLVGEAGTFAVVATATDATGAATDLTITDAGDHRATIAEFAGTVQAEAAGAGPPVTHATLSLTDIVFPSAWDLPLGPAVSRVDVVAALSGAPPVAATAPAIRAWSDAGGLVEVEAVDIAYGPATLAGNGTFTFDADGQPLAAFSVTMRGFLEAVNALRDRGLMRTEDAFAARFILSAMARTPEDGGPPELSAGLSVQDRELSIGPLVLLRLPALVWPDSAAPPAR